MLFRSGQEVDVIFLAPVNFLVALLPAMAADFADGHAIDADVLQGFFDFFHLERLYYRFDLFHDLPDDLPLYPDADLPQTISDRLAEILPPLPGHGCVALNARRSINCEAFLLENPLHAKQVVTVAYYDAGVQAHASKNLGCRGQRVSGRFSFILNDDRFRGNAAVCEIRPADPGFGEIGIAARSSGGHDVRRELALVEISCVVKPQFENGRRVPAIFGSAHHDDHVGAPGFVLPALAANSGRKRDQIAEREHHYGQSQKTGHALEVRYSYLNIVIRGRANRIGYQYCESACQRRTARDRARRPDR